ncbi:hypothetical protein [Flindersiella endophytica]
MAAVAPAATATSPPVAAVPAVAAAAVTMPVQERARPVAPPAGGARGTTGRGRPRLLPAQFVCWQLAIGLVVASAGRPWWVLVAATLTALALVALTTTWRRDLWTYQRAVLGIRYAVRSPRFVPIEAVRGTLEIGDTEAAVIARPDGLTVLLELGAPVELSDLRTELCLSSPRGLRPHGPTPLLPAKLLLQRGRSWVALTAPRTAGRHQDAELELLLANAVRRLVKRLPTVPLAADELLDVLARFTSKHAREEWNGLRLWTGHYRVYAIRPDLSDIPRGTVTITLSTELDQALALVPAGAPAGPGAVPLTGRQRSAFALALP